MNKQQVSKPLPPLPILLFHNHIHSFYQLACGKIQQLTKGERPKLISKTDYENFIAIFNR